MGFYNRCQVLQSSQCLSLIPRLGSAPRVYLTAGRAEKALPVSARTRSLYRLTRSVRNALQTRLQGSDSRPFQAECDLPPPSLDLRVPLLRWKAGHNLKSSDLPSGISLSHANSNSPLQAVNKINALQLPAPA